LAFEPVTTTEVIERLYSNTDLSPKEFLFPRTEAVLHYARDQGTVLVQGLEPDVSETVLFGVRPCDAAGMSRLHRVFSTDVRDEFFLRRLDNTTVVSVSCADPQEWCFCTAVGLGPAASEGSDLLLTEVQPEVYLAEALTAKGEAIVERHSDLFSEQGGAEKEPAAAAARARITRTRDLTDLRPRVDESFGDERWERFGMACLGCGACAYCCPTCHCFDLIEDGSPSEGRRLKTWDCCAFSGFTVHASGHNPRARQGERYRQRVLHKFAYFPERFGRLMCVGCGRCVRSCPAGQDIYEAAVSMLAPGGGEP
jgi:ferredoxin